MEMSFKVRHCTPLGLSLVCTDSPSWHLVSYGYYHGGSARGNWIAE